MLQIGKKFAIIFLTDFKRIEKMSLIIKEGTLKYPADRLFDDPWNPGGHQQNIVCSMTDGTEERIYFKAYRQPHADLKPGDRIQIVFETDPQTGKTRRRLVDNRDANSPQQQQQNQQHQQQLFQQATSQPKQSADMFIAERLAIYNEVLERVKHCNFALKLSDSDKSDIATSILIEGTRNRVNFRELLVTQDQIVPPSKPVPVKEIHSHNQSEQIPAEKLMPVAQTSFEVDYDEIPF